jgi:hypothetical protein
VLRRTPYASASSVPFDASAWTSSFPMTESHLVRLGTWVPPYNRGRPHGSWVQNLPSRRPRAPSGRTVMHCRPSSRGDADLGRAPSRVPARGRRVTRYQWILEPACRGLETGQQALEFCCDGRRVRVESRVLIHRPRSGEARCAVATVAGPVERRQLDRPLGVPVHRPLRSTSGVRRGPSVCWRIC